MGFLTDLIKDKTQQKSSETAAKAASLKALLHDKDADPEHKAWAMQELTKAAGLGKKESANLLKLVSQLTQGAGATDGGSDQLPQPSPDSIVSGAKVQQPQPTPAAPAPDASTPAPAPAPEKPKHPVRNALLSILAGGLSGGATVQEQYKRDEEKRAAATRQNELEQASKSRLAEQSEIEQQRMNDAVEEARQKGEIASKQEEVDYRKKFKRAQELMKGGMGEEQAFTSAGLPYKAPPVVKGQIKVAPDDPDKPEGAYHYEELLPDGTSQNRGPAPRPASAKPPTDPAAVKSAMWVQQHLNDPDPQVRAAAKQMNDKANAAIQAAGQQKLDPATLDFLAERGLVTGQDPTFGMGNAAAGNRVEYYKALTRKAMDNGDTPAALVATQSMVKAARTALPKVQQTYSQTKVNEDNAVKNFELLKQLGQRMDAGSWQVAIPALNSLVRTGTVMTTGNPAVNNFLSTLNVAMTEYAKVVTGQTGGTAVSDAARKEIGNLLSKGLSTSSINDWIENAAKPDMANRTSSYRDQLDSLQQTIRDAGGSVGGGGDTGKGKAPKGMVTIESKGKRYQIPAGNLDAAKKRDPNLKVLP